MDYHVQNRVCLKLRKTPTVEESEEKRHERIAIKEMKSLDKLEESEQRSINTFYSTADDRTPTERAIANMRNSENPINPNDEWQDAWRKLQDICFTEEEIDDIWYYGLPGGKKASEGGQEGIDYLIGSEKPYAFAADHLNWTPDFFTAKYIEERDSKKKEEKREERREKREEES